MDGRKEGSNYCYKHEIIVEQRRKEQITEGLEEGKFEYEDEILCPYCGEVYEDDEYQFYEEGEHEVECYHCEKTFNLNTHVTYSYSTNIIDEDE
jgi:transposase-like protein